MKAKYYAELLGLPTPIAWWLVKTTTLKARWKILERRILKCLK